MPSNIRSSELHTNPCHRYEGNNGSESNRVQLRRKFHFRMSVYQSITKGHGTLEMASHHHLGVDENPLGFPLPARVKATHANVFPLLFYQKYWSDLILMSFESAHGLKC